MSYQMRVNGESLTNLIRQAWAEGRLSVALNLCEDSGAPEESHIDICTGKQKICGVGDLWLEPDNVTTHCGFDITLESTVTRLEEKYVKLHTQFANADLRMRYFTLRCDWAGIQYRNFDKSPVRAMSSYDVKESSYEKDSIIIERVGKELAELEPLFRVLYPLVGKTMGDVPYYKFTDDEDIFQPDLDHPYYLPNLGKTKISKTEVDEKGERVVSVYKGIPILPKKAIEQDKTTKENELPELTDHIKIEKEVRPIVPEGIDNPYVENAWIDRNGDFYGDMRMSIGSVFVHIELAEQLLENNIIPKTDISPEKYLEQEGWVKLSRNEVLFNPKDKKCDYTPSQKATLKKYAEFRKLEYINIGVFGKKIKVSELDNLYHF